MNKFDFIQFSLPSECIIEPNKKYLTTVKEINGNERYVLTDSGRNMISQHDFRMEFKIHEEKALIGVSSKILGFDYPELIHNGNLTGCFTEMRNYGLFKDIDVPLASKEGKCTRLEVTRDIELGLTEEDYEDMAKMVFDTRKWNIQVLRNSFGVMRSDNSESIKLYNKGHEMKRSKKNRQYAQDFKLEGRFDGLTRVESKIQSAKAIRRRFGDNNVSHVFTSLTNPLADIVDEVFIDLPDYGSNHTIKGNFLKKNRDRQRLSYAMEFGFNFGHMATDMKSRDPDNWTREFNRVKTIAETENTAIRDTADKINLVKNLLIFT